MRRVIHAQKTLITLLIFTPYKKYIFVISQNLNFLCAIYARNLCLLKWYRPQKVLWTPLLHLSFLYGVLLLFCLYVWGFIWGSLVWSYKRGLVSCCLLLIRESCWLGSRYSLVPVGAINYMCNPLLPPPPPPPPLHDLAYYVTRCMIMNDWGIFLTHLYLYRPKMPSQFSQYLALWMD